MIRKLVISVFFFTICFNVAFIYQDNLHILSDKNSRFNYFKKVFGKIDSILHRTKISPPKDTAKIQVTVYPPINLGETTDYKYRLGAYEAWEKGKTMKEGNYQAIIDSLNLVKNKIDVDWRLLANCYYRLNKKNMALNAGEKIKRPDGRTLYALGLLALELQQYKRAAKHFKNPYPLANPCVPCVTYAHGSCRTWLGMDRARSHRPA